MITNVKAKLSPKSYFPIHLRWKIIQMIEAKLLTEKQACQRHRISLTLIRRWRRQYYQRQLLPLLTPTAMKTKQNPQEEIKALKAQIEALKKQNEQLQLEAFAHKTMVDIAEKELNIVIRKKSGAKQ